MNYETFLEQCMAAVEIEYAKFDDDYTTEQGVGDFWKKRHIEDEPSIYIRWCVGGYSGGNCWGGKARGFRTDHSFEHIPAVKQLLRSVAPNVTFLQYDDICALEQKDEYIDREYYGNINNYKILHIPVKVLYDFLVENKLLKIDG